MIATEEFVSFKIGHWLGAFIEILSHYLWVVLICYMIFRLVNYKRSINDGR